MRNEQFGDWMQDSNKIKQWPVGDPEMGQSGGRSDHATGGEEYLIQPLTPLSFDTILTAGDIKRLMRIVSVI